MGFCAEYQGVFMPNTRIAQVSLLASLVVAVALFADRATLVSAQEGQSSAAQRALPIRHPSGTKLTEQQVRGAGVFFQRCSLCHLAKTFGANGNKICCVASLGPDLSAQFKDLTPDQESAYREIIMNGGPTYMPAWKYGLTPQEVDDIIAYLKTLG
jgi:mono/diheme cytochrome c family protein